VKFQFDSDEALWLDMIRTYIQSGRLSDNQRAIEFADSILAALRERRSPITVPSDAWAQLQSQSPPNLCIATTEKA
jgi:hypothetical protein